MQFCVDQEAEEKRGSDKQELLFSYFSSCLVGLGVCFLSVSKTTNFPLLISRTTTILLPVQKQQMMRSAPLSASSKVGTLDFVYISHVYLIFWVKP